MKSKITKRVVDALKPGAKDSFLWDADMQGFGVKVTPKGKKVYLVQTRFQGVVRRFTIGTHGSPWSPDEAREKATVILGKLAEGIDPMAEDKAAKRNLTLNELCDDYIAKACGHKSPSTLAVEAGLLKRHIRPLLGSKRIGNISHADGLKFMKDIAEGRTAVDVKTVKRGRAIVKGGMGTANRTAALLSSIFSYAVREQIVDANPMERMRKFKEGRHERFLTEDDVKSLGTTMAKMEKDGANKVLLNALRLLMLTGCRKSEILGLKWEWVDFKRGTLNLPTSKTGLKRVLLGESALTLLETLPHYDGSAYVFPASRGEGHAVGLTKLWHKVREAAELPEVRVHDIRHSFASFGVSGGQSLYTVGKILGHSKAQTTQRYAHLSDDPVKRAVDEVSKKIGNILGI